MQELPDSYTIRTIDMPAAVGGTIAESPDGHINIYLNARLTRAGQEEALEHELEHWRNDDLHNDDDIETVEARASHRKPAAQLIRASSIPRPKPKPNRITAPVRVDTEDRRDWINDTFIKLPFFDSYGPS